MTDRPGREGRPAEEVTGRSEVRDHDDLIVVPHRTNHQSAKLLPPILMLLLATGFLAYRSARSSDWRGISAFFESHPSKPVAAKPRLLARATEPVPKPELPPAAEPVPAETKPVETAQVEPEHVQEKPAAADPLSDIEKEAAKTRERIAELEKLKENEAKKLDETADERQREELAERRKNMRFGLGPIPPEQLERMIQAQNEMLRRQMDQMAEMQRRFFSGRGFGFDRNPANGMPFPFPGVPGLNANPGQMRSLPNGGVTRFREFNGPGGMRGFTFEFRQGGPFPDDPDKEVPPPPKPRNGPKRID